MYKCKFCSFQTSDKTLFHQHLRSEHESFVSHHDDDSLFDNLSTYIIAEEIATSFGDNNFDSNIGGMPDSSSSDFSGGGGDFGGGGSSGSF